MIEFTNYLTADEVQAAQTLHKRAPYSITQIRSGYFSLARKAGAITFQGCDYTYMGDDYDECVRDDVLKLVTELRTNRPGKDVPAPQPTPNQEG